MVAASEFGLQSDTPATGVRKHLRILFLGNAYNPISVECALALSGTGHEVLLASYEPLSKGFLRVVVDSWRKHGPGFVLRKSLTLLRCRARIGLRSLGVPLRTTASLPEAAMSRKLRTVKMVSPNDPQFVSSVRDEGVDLIAVAAFSRILKKVIIAAPPLGCLNVHPSLLPKYRGPNPMYWVLANRESVTGVTIHYIDEGVDTGPILLQRELPISPGEGEASLLRRCARLAAELLPVAVSQVANGHAMPRVQDETQASYCPNAPRGASAL